MLIATKDQEIGPLTMEKSADDRKQEAGGPPSYEETMRQDAIRSNRTEHTHIPKRTSRRGYPGGEQLTYSGAKNAK